MFKAEVAHATPHAAQIQGVWVAPDRRGAGAGRRAVWPPSSTHAAARSPRWCRCTPTIWNEPARRAYERVGFQQTGTFATMMF